MKNKNLIQYINVNGIVYTFTLGYFIDINRDRWHDIINGQCKATIKELQTIADFFGADVETLRD